MGNKDSKAYSELSNVEKSQNFLSAEEFPEGPYGSPRALSEPVRNKSSEWQEGQRFYSAFNYENKSLHQEMPRQMEGAHPTHDDPDQDVQSPYTP